MKQTFITADEAMTVKYIESRMEDEINYYLKKNPFVEREDILKVVQIIDTDGAFIPSAMIQLYYDRNFKLYDQKHA